MNKIQKKDITGLVDDTIIPALFEDFAWKTVAEFEEGTQFIIDKLLQLKLDAQSKYSYLFEK